MTSHDLEMLRQEVHKALYLQPSPPAKGIEMLSDLLRYVDELQAEIDAYKADVERREAMY